MTVTSTLMETGDWSVSLDPSTPGAIRERLRDWYAFLTVTKQRMPLDAVAAITRPLFRGPLLERSGNALTLGGADMAWYLGSSSTDLSQVNGWGPYLATLWNGATSGMLADICAKNGLTPGTLGAGVPTTVKGGINGSARTALDLIAVPVLGCEWRVRPDATVELYMASAATASPVAVITDDPGGREPSSQMAGWHLSSENVDLSVRDRRNREVTRYGNPLTSISTSAPTGWPKGWGGAQVEIAGYNMFNGDAGDAPGFTNGQLVKEAQVLSSLTVDVDDYLAIAQLASPDLLCGASVLVYSTDIGVYDTSQPPVYWRGRQIFPVSLRCTQVTWPITRGMGVYLDNRHQGGGITDLTDYVAWDSTDAGSGQAMTVTLGAMPRQLSGGRIPISG